MPLVQLSAMHRASRRAEARVALRATEHLRAGMAALLSEKNTEAHRESATRLLKQAEDYGEQQ